MTKHFNEITKKMEILGRRYDLSKVFNDLLTMSICAYHQTNIQSGLKEKDEANEQLYFQAIKGYSKDDLITFGEILGELKLNVLDDPYSDILGEYFMQHITKGQNGQYFTPAPICQMMALMQGDNSDAQSLKRVFDPACGSGRMLMSHAKLNPRNHYYGADNSNTCAKMATLNFLLNGLIGEIAWMNSLSNEWYGGWHINTNGIGILPIEKEQSVVWINPSLSKSSTAKIDTTPIENPSERIYQKQLTFF